MDYETTENILKPLTTILLVAIVAFFSFTAGWDLGTKKILREAVEAEVAEWVFDKETGHRKFEFITRDNTNE